MMRQRKCRSILRIFLASALLLLAVPGIPGSAQSGEISVSSGTTAGELNGSPDLSGTGVQVSVLGKDGSARTGAVQDGDTVVVTNPDGSRSSYRISLSGSSAAQNSAAAEIPSVSSAASASAARAPAASASSAAQTAGRKDGPYLFPGQVTVSQLAGQLSSGSGNSDLFLRVVKPSGEERADGYVCTGDAVNVVDSVTGEEVSSVTAVIPGDVTRCGGPSKAGCELLYECLTGKRSLSGDLFAAADLNGNGEMDTADLLLMKKALYDAS